MDLADDFAYSGIAQKVAAIEGLAEAPLIPTRSSS